MEANPRKLLDEFIPEAMGKQFVIPVYQRKYTWTVNKQLKQLISDLKELIANDNKEHFLGTIIYLETNVNYKTERSIVDGQQRLVTMFLIAAALKSLADNKYRAELISQQYLENMPEPPESKYRQRLYPAVSDEDDYKLVIANRYDELRDKNSNIAKNFLYLQNQLSKLIETYNFDQVLFALKRFTIVYIKLDKHDDAQQIFESINSNGELLTASDLIRNFIMMDKSNHEQTMLYNNYWKILENTFDSSKKIEEFFRFYLASVTNELTEKKNLYTAFKRFYIEQKQQSDDELLLQHIVRYAKYFSMLYYDDLKKPREELEDYRVISSMMPAPFMLAISDLCFHKGSITEEQFYGVMKIINTYLIRRTFAGMDTSRVSRAFPVYLKRVKEIVKTNGYKDIEDIIIYVLVNKNRSNNMALPTDKNLESFMMGANAYTMNLTHWLLEKIENHENNAKLDMSSFEVEHIMPQTSTDYWVKQAGVADEDYTNLVNTIGNLTLVTKSDNSAAGNRNFETKKKVFNTTLHIHMNNDLFAMNSWTSKDINERSKKIISILINMFPYLRAKRDYEFKENCKVYLSAQGIYAEGYLNADNSLTIYPGAQLLSSEKINGRVAKIRNDMLNNGDLKEIDGQLILQSRYTSSPSNTAELLLGGSRNGWNYWKSSNNIAIGDDLR